MEKDTTAEPVDTRGPSNRGVIIWFVLFGVAYSAFRFATVPYALTSEWLLFWIGETLPGALLFVLVPAAAATIIWAFVGFRKERAGLFVGAWAASFGILVLLAEVGKHYADKIATD